MDMRMTGTAGALAGMLMIGATAVQAEPWKGEAELGVVKTSGNSESQSIAAKAAATKEYDKWRHSGKLEALNTSADGTRSAERYLAGFKSDYRFTAKDYVFGTINYENDRFSGYEYRLSEAVGYGRRLIERTSLTLDAEIGPGARHSKLQGGDREDEFIVRANGKLVWTISPTAVFSEDLTVEAGDDATITRSVTALKVQIADSLAMKVAYTVKNTSDVPAGVKKTDTETVLTLVYGF